MNNQETNKCERYSCCNCGNKSCVLNDINCSKFIHKEPQTKPTTQELLKEAMGLLNRFMDDPESTYVVQDTYNFLCNTGYYKK